MSVWVKICGVTIEEDALDAVDAGADAVGVNLVPSSKRRVEVSVARAIHDAVGSRAQVIAASNLAFNIRDSWRA
jgi:phosphoribosylanthranilate isomerase